MRKNGASTTTVKLRRRKRSTPATQGDMMLEFKRPKKSESTVELQQGLGEQMSTAVTNVIAESSPCSIAIDVVNGNLLPRNRISIIQKWNLWEECRRRNRTPLENILQHLAKQKLQQKH